MRGGDSWIRSFLLVAVIAVGVVFESSALEVVVESRTVPVTQTPTVYYIDVYLRLAPGESPPSVAGYQVAVNLVPNGVVAIKNPFAQLTGVAHPPLITENLLPNFGGDNGPLRASAAAFRSSGTTLVATSRGLMRVPVEVQPNTTGVFQIAVDQDAVRGTVLADGVANPIPYAAVTGQLYVASSVPALSQSGLVALAMALSLLAWIEISRRAASRGGSGRSN